MWTVQIRWHLCPARWQVYLPVEHIAFETKQGAQEMLRLIRRQQNPYGPLRVKERPDCVLTEVSSRVCEHGTRCCDVRHKRRSSRN